jgi:DNA-binding IclR family transcriptional regulator
MADSSTHIVKSAQRVLEVIEYFNEERQAASVTEVSRALAYPQSSTSVLLKCLWQLGYLYYNRQHRKYRLTARAALLGCWAEMGKYRGGPAIELVDAVAERTGETVILSAGNIDYALHHLNVKKGASPTAIDVSAGAAEPLLNNIQGELQLASYPDSHIRLALHRLNAEERNPDKRVNIDEKLAEFQVMRERGWGIGPHATLLGVSAVAVMLPRHKGGDRIVISVVAADHVIERCGDEFVTLILDERDRHFELPIDSDEDRIDRPACAIGVALDGTTAMHPAMTGRDVS